MDDEKLVYPLYEAMLKRGINTICIHKGLMPADYMTSWADMWQYATVWDVGKAAKDWPQINFVIYHSAMRPFLELPDRELAQFEKTGRFDWVSDLADIPAKFGVNNVYGELGACFANTCVTHPKLAAALMGTLIKGLGEDKVIWGHGLSSGGARRSGRSKPCAVSKSGRHAEEVRLQGRSGRGWSGENENLRRQRLRGSTRSIHPQRRKCPPTTSMPSRRNSWRWVGCRATCAMGTSAPEHAVPTLISASAHCAPHARPMRNRGSPGRRARCCEPSCLAR
jgi:hypothetical protein